ncbi:alanyl-tRNA editing protein [Candidatus Tisiphia endosymbiont of Nemotelus nigrinus]|uniref:alanyl-tRNA editing protein n=1 Tax=Candidatus Tisiphia endosymbiont of Nemotelus nigrinus TaxID=3066263 RepID=UPI00312CB751
MTKQLYLTDTYLFESNAYIITKKEDDRGNYLLLDQTIFYPQGGGQPSDQGFIRGDDFVLKVVSVRQVENEVRHYLEDTTLSLDGKETKCLLDKDRRILNARYHTAAHPLGNIVEALYPSLKAIKGHSFPNESYVNFQGSDIPDIDKLQDDIDKIIAVGYKIIIFESDPISFEQQFYKLPYHIPNNKVFRVMQIENFAPVPCGGTHLSTTKEIISIILGKIKTKNDIVCISYKL